MGACISNVIIQVLFERNLDALIHLNGQFRGIADCDPEVVNMLISRHLGRGRNPVRQISRIGRRKEDLLLIRVLGVNTKLPAIEPCRQKILVNHERGHIRHATADRRQRLNSHGYFFVQKRDHSRVIRPAIRPFAIPDSQAVDLERSARLDFG